MPPKPDFVFTCDPGHAWLLVGASDLADLDLDARDFTVASTRSPGGVIALEEDHDAEVFIKAWEQRRGRRMNVADHHCAGDAPCRLWPSFGLADDDAILARFPENLARAPSR